MDLSICGWPPLGGLGFGLLEPVQEINGTLRVGSYLEDRALIVCSARPGEDSVQIQLRVSSARTMTSPTAQ
jgi:hypothetical protein